MDGGVSQCQLSSHRDDEVQVTEAHVCTRDLANSVASHPWPDVIVGTRKGPLPGMPTVGVSSKHQLVNLYYCALGPNGVLKRQGLYWFEQNVPMSSLWSLLMLFALKGS